MSKAPEANLDEEAPEAHLTSIAPAKVRVFCHVSTRAVWSVAVVHIGLIAFKVVVPCLPVHCMIMHDVPAVQVASQEPVLPPMSLAALQAVSSFAWTGSLPSIVVKVPTQHCAWAYVHTRTMITKRRVPFIVHCVEDMRCLCLLVLEH